MNLFLRKIITQIMPNRSDDVLMDIYSRRKEPIQRRKMKLLRR
ncbi:MAG: hypothetical protein UR42_C0013G0001 [Candidatus Roizmanbacteria bacterium GW2011_GWA2_33_33]|uniref:Uncharacterized protein n=1 Tax=Candidatus Roizmanbacteria bacterium GW2011_GWA2_33_33 TaxID=1618476 RepID=A0A0G0CK49_9BACT|nr:MAG: hypothetical protein UR42_C0013G0001 [Candidatus Roizmanbacteria bacterium GW2011_GWA2_33_33]